jgi:glyoxylase-like metal-dependent hydrolase (beta-lactamase superfamily II)
MMATISYSRTTFRAGTEFPKREEDGSMEVDRMMDEHPGIRGRIRRCRALGIELGAVLMAVFSMIWSVAVAAQQDFSKVEIKTIDLGSGLAMLQGAGGNIGVSTGPDGVFLIDDQFAPLTEKIRAAIRELSKEPIRFVLNTHWHGDHTGGNENLGEAGVLILAHHRVRERLSTEQFQAIRNRTIPASPKVAWPVVTFEDGVTLHLNGQTIEVTHVDPAHTDGDSIVYFSEADLLHMGDIYFSGMYPFIDTSSGGRIDGMIAAADRALAIAGPKTRIIPGHGPLSNREDLSQTREMLISVRDRVRNFMNEGLDRDQVIARQPSKDFDGEYGGGFMKPDVFVGIVFDSLKSR